MLVHSQWANEQMKKKEARFKATTTVTVTSLPLQPSQGTAQSAPHQSVSDVKQTEEMSNAQFLDALDMLHASLSPESTNQTSPAPSPILPIDDAFDVAMPSLSIESSINSSNSNPLSPQLYSANASGPKQYTFEIAPRTSQLPPSFPSKAQLPSGLKEATPQMIKANFEYLCKIMEESSDEEVDGSVMNEIANTVMNMQQELDIEESIEC